MGNIFLALIIIILGALSILYLHSPRPKEKNTSNIRIPINSSAFTMPITKETAYDKLVKTSFNKNAPVVFFDIDGVLHRNDNESLEFKHLLLNMVSMIPDIQFIMCSNWRITAEKEWFENKLGVELTTYFKGCTPVLKPMEYRRENEITSFVDHYNVKNFIVFDDNPSLYSANFARLIVTEKSKGLTSEDIANAINIIK